MLGHCQTRLINIPSDLVFRAIDSLNAYKEYKTYTTSLEGYADSLAKKISLCEKSNSEKQQAYDAMVKANEAASNIIDLNRIKEVGYKQEIKDLQHQNTKLRIIDGIFKIILTAEGIRLIYNSLK